MEVATPDGGKIWVEVQGTGDPIVLLSGMSQDHTALAAQGSLANEFQLICPDKRGTGRSSDVDIIGERGREPFTCGDFADDVITVLKGLGISRAHIVGFSMGGRIAQWVAIRFPRYVGSLVLISSSMGDSRGEMRTSETERIMKLSQPMELALLNYSASWIASHPAETQALHASHTERASQRAIHFEAVRSHDSWGSLPSIKAPTLVIHGNEDRVNPILNGKLMAERIPGAEFVEISGGRHGVAAEFADEVNRYIRDFLTAHPLS
ncbi:MAG: alpha/beta fold hydrolase [Propionibacteriaceae bacterium]